MSRPALRTMCRRCQTHFLTTSLKPLTLIPKPNTRTITTTPQRAQDDDFRVFEKALSSTIPTSPRGKAPTNTVLENLAKGARDEASTRPSSAVSEDEPYHLTVYSHKHNMHITFTEPSRDPILSFSAGNVGLKKAHRGTYDATYQLSVFMFRKMVEKQWRTGGKGMTANKLMTLADPDVRTRGIEIVLRGFGGGRMAFQQALLGNEGKVIKPFIKKVTDNTRLKFGGTRSPQVRRLG